MRTLKEKKNEKKKKKKDTLREHSIVSPIETWNEMCISGLSKEVESV